MAAFDAEVDAEPISSDEVKASRMRDVMVRMDRLDNRQRAIAEYQRAYYEAHKAEIAEYQRAYYAKSSLENAEKSLLRAWRRERGLRQSDVAKMLDVTQGLVSMMERGVVPLSRKVLEVINAEI